MLPFRPCTRPVSPLQPESRRALHIQVYLGFFAPDSIRFILFLALMPFGISCITIFFLNHVPFVTTSEGAELGGPVNHVLRRLSATPPLLETCPWLTCAFVGHGM